MRVEFHAEAIEELQGAAFAEGQRRFLDYHRENVLRMSRGR